MDTFLDATYFSLLDAPNLHLKTPGWFKKPTPMMLFGLIISSYFLITGGVIYDIINEPPSVGSTTDERGNSRPVAIMQHRINGQYIMEGLAASFMFTLGGLGFIILDFCNNPLMPKLNRTMFLGLGLSCVFIAFFAIRMFMRIKMPGYMHH